VHLIEDQYPVMKGEFAELVIAGGEAVDGGGGRIDESAECASEDGLAASGGSVEDQDGIRRSGAEGGGEPRCYRVPGVGWEIEKTLQRG
jgi:hypothetical protein